MYNLILILLFKNYILYICKETRMEGYIPNITSGYFLVGLWVIMVSLLDSIF